MIFMWQRERERERERFLKISRDLERLRENDIDLVTIVISTSCFFRAKIINNKL